jgi:protein TonB
MTMRKKSKHDLEQQRTAFFLIGLMFTGSVTLAALNYREPDLTLHRQVNTHIDYTPVLFDPVIREMLKTEPIIEQNNDQSQSTVDAQGLANEQSTSIVNSQTTATSEAGIDLSGLLGGPKIIIGGGIIDINLEDKAHMYVDKEAEFIGGYIEMVKYVQNELNYPTDAMAFNVQEKITVSFIVEKDGSITNVKAIVGSSRSLKKEAERIVKSFPKWKPGELNYANVRTILTLPIDFRLKP